MFATDTSMKRPFPADARFKPIRPTRPGSLPAISPIPDGRRRCALDDPAVAIRVTEVGKLHPAHVLDLTDIGTPAQELGAYRSHIGYDELQPLEDAWRHAGHSGPYDDRRSRTRRGQLYDPHSGDVLDIVVKNKAQFLQIEGL